MDIPKGKLNSEVISILKSITGKDEITIEQKYHPPESYVKGDELFRTAIKTKHGRLIYLELTKSGSDFAVVECYYIDRVKSGKYYAVPSKQQTKRCNADELLEVVSLELDRRYYGLEFTDELADLSTESFIKNRLLSFKWGYKFLIFVGEGGTVNGMPDKLKTRLANRIHRKIYLEIDRYDEHKGVVTKCCYYDRQYKSRDNVTPQMLTSVFVDYDRKSIMDMVNRELNCDFTDLIIIDDTISAIMPCAAIYIVRNGVEYESLFHS